MIPINLGLDLDTRRRVRLNREGLRRHLHLIGATGAGKTNAIHNILRPLMMEPGSQKCCLFVIDPMGGLSMDLLQWIASRKCPDHVRRRLLYIDASSSDYVIPFNPLHAARGDARYYHVARSVDLILRAWTAQDLASQPRLMQWSYKALAAVAALGFPIAMSRFLLHPGTDEHRAILSRIPGEIASHWTQILKASGSEAVKILESTRNRFDPFYEAPQAKRIFGSTENRFDVEEFIRDRRIVIVNVSKQGRLPGMLGDTIGALVLNEILETASRLSSRYGREVVDPTYVLMDEFQKFISPDIEDALPTVRQMGLRLMMANQSFSQLERGDLDLTSMIWQAQNRMMFVNSAEDADLVANELAVLTFDPYRIKHELKSRRQKIVGYRREWLRTSSSTSGHSAGESHQHAVGYGHTFGESKRTGDVNRTENKNNSNQHSDVKGGSNTTSSSRTDGEHEVNVPIHEEVEETSSVTFFPFEEHRLEWSRTIRQLRTGEAFGKFLDDPNLYRILVDYAPVRVTTELRERMAELLEQNYSQKYFMSATEADDAAEQDRLLLLGHTPNQKLILPEPDTAVPQPEPATLTDPEPDDDEEGGSSLFNIPARKS